MPALETTFYEYLGTVARIARTPSSTSVAIYAGGRWIERPGIYGKLTGLGGDPPADEISRDEATAILARVDAPPREDPTIDGPPWSERPYSSSRRS